MIVPPGSTIGIIGGGQLGRMMAIAAAELGYRCHLLAPDADPPAGDVAAKVTRVSYDDLAALRSFADQIDVATYEFENLPAASLAMLGDKLRPSIASLEIAQDRAAEKQFLERNGVPIARWLPVGSAADALRAEADLGLPLVIKSRRLGYDGKGQAWARSTAETAEAWSAIGSQPAVAEAGVDFLAEYSVIIARGADGATAVWDIPRNSHRDGILRRSEVPAGAPIDSQSEEAFAIAKRIAEALGHIGVLTVEFFATTEGPVVNEIAPRVHNSGHWTIEGAVTSQFEQHVRAICGLPLGSPRLSGGSVSMDNLIGDDVDRWADLIAEPGAHVHLYRKGQARSGRKMGHVTRVG